MDNPKISARIARGAWALLFASGCLWLQSAFAESDRPQCSDVQHRVVAYVASWSVPPVIHPEKLTHINFAFAHIDRAGHVVLDEPGAGASLRNLQRLKKQNPALKIILSIGGWQAEGFSDAALTGSSRRAFARSAVQLLRDYALDGLDLDWEYPGQGVAGIKYRAADKQNFTLLLQTLREQLDLQGKRRRRTGSNPYALTIAAADREYFDHTEMDRVHVYLDWINLMSYDFFNSLTPTTGHHAGLYRSEHAAAADRNADAAVSQYLRAGIPADKIVLGVAFYGRGFAGVTAVNNGVNQRYERFEGEHSYAQLTDRFIGRQGYVRYWDAHAQAPYLWNGAARIFISYEDPESIAIKARYALDRHLGGIMFWELSQDRDGALLDAISPCGRRLPTSGRERVSASGYAAPRPRS